MQWMRRAAMFAVALLGALAAPLSSPARAAPASAGEYGTISRVWFRPTTGTGDLTSVRPGQKFKLWASSGGGTCNCYGWSMSLSIQFPPDVVFLEDEFSIYFPVIDVQAGSVTVAVPPGDPGGLAGFYTGFPFQVKPADELSGAPDLRFSLHATAGDPDGATGEDDEQAALPVVGLPMGVSVDATTPRPGYVRPGDEVLWRIVGNPGELVSRLTIENPLPDQKVGTLVPDSASPPAQVKGGKLVWTYDDVDTPQTVTFRVQLAEEFPKKTKEIADTATVRTSGGASKSATRKVPVARATLVAGDVRDAIVEFPRRTSVVLRPPRAPRGREILARLLAKGDGSEVDSAPLGHDGSYALQAVDAGDYVVRIETDADRYSEATDTVDEGAVKLVQQRDVTVPTAAANPEGEPVEVDTILFPMSLANGLAQRLLRLNDMAPRFGGFVPLPTSFDTGGIPAGIEALLADQDEVFAEIYDGTGERDGWNAAIRLDAILAIAEQRFLDNAKLADVFSKSVSLLVTIEVMKKLGPKIVDRWKAANGDPKFVPADMRSRTIEAVKIATLAYGVGYILPALLEQTELSSVQKALIIETVAKAVRFGLNTFVAAQNQQDIVFEAIFQVMRVALFAAFNEAIFIPIVERELARASGMFANRGIAEDTTATLAWLALYDERVGNRSKENFGVAADALKKLSLFVRGIDGVLFKAQQAMGYSSKPAISGKLRSNTNGLLKFLEKPKLAASLTAFSLAIGAPLMEQAYLYQDIEVEVNAAFGGPSGLGPPVPPGEGLASTIGNEILRDIDFWFGTRWAPAEEKRDDVPVTPPEPEVAAYLAALDGVESAVAAGDVPGYEAARTALLASHDALFARLRAPAEQALVVLKDDPSADRVLIGLEGARYETGNGIALAYEHLEVWAAEPSRPNARSALASIASLRAILATVSGALVGSEAALARRSVPAVLAVSGGPDGEDLPAASAVRLSFTVRNLGNASSEESTARLEPSDAFALSGPAEATVPALAPGGSATVEFDVTTAAARRAASYVLLLEQPDGTFIPHQGYVVIEP